MSDIFDMLMNAYEEQARDCIERGLDLEQSKAYLIGFSPGLANDTIFSENFPLCYVVAECKLMKSQKTKD